MKISHFVKHRPVLFHYTTPNGVARLRSHGLWCTEDMLENYGVGRARIAELTHFLDATPSLLITTSTAQRD